MVPIVTHYHADWSWSTRIPLHFQMTGYIHVQCVRVSNMSLRRASRYALPRPSPLRWHDLRSATRNQSQLRAKRDARGGRLETELEGLAIENLTNLDDLAELVLDRPGNADRDAVCLVDACHLKLEEELGLFDERD